MSLHGTLAPPQAFGGLSAATGAMLDGNFNYLANLVLDSVAQLRAMTAATDPQVPPRAITVGYYNPGDGGGGAYWYNPADTTSPDNGGTIIVASDGSRWYLAPQGYPTLKQFGATGNGVSSDSAAIAAALALGETVYAPPGVYNIGTATFTGSGGGIIGAGQGATTFVSTDTSSAYIFSYSAANNTIPGYATLTFKDFTLSCASGKTTGGGITITSPSGEDDGHLFSGVTISNAPTSIQFVKSALWSVQNCNFENYTVAGLDIANSNNPDSGDSVVMGCQFYSVKSGSPIGIIHRSSGGLKVTSNKFNGGYAGFVTQLNASASTSDTLLIGNSIENMTNYGIYFSRTSGSATISHIIIEGNQIAIGEAYGVAFDNSGAWIDMIIAGNSIGVGTGLGGNAIALNSGTQFSIYGNNLIGTSTGAAINIAAACSNGKIGVNSYNWPGSSGVLITNNSTSTTIAYDIQKAPAGVSVTTSTGYGSLFIGTTAVTFPTPFTQVPTVKCFLGAGNAGQISAFATAITTTGFTLNVIGITNSGATTGTLWEASGII